MNISLKNFYGRFDNFLRDFKSSPRNGCNLRVAPGQKPLKATEIASYYRYGDEEFQKKTLENLKPQNIHLNSTQNFRTKTQLVKNI